MRAGEKTVVLVERSGDIFIARIKGDLDAGSRFTGRSAAEAVGWLVINLGFSLNLRIIQKG